MGCGSRESAPRDGDIRVTVWAHTGQQEERETLANLVEQFNGANEGIEVDITFLPDGSYNAQVQSAALANDLPDVLEFDGPFVYNYAWQGHLRPLRQYLSSGTMDNLLPSIVEQGAYDDTFYSVGMYDSGLGLYARKSMLEAAGVRIPQSPDDAWPVEEFEQALAALSERDGDGQVLDLKLNYDGEWYCYAFSPPLQSAGADLIDRGDYAHAAGVLDSEAAVSVMQRFQRWRNEDGYIDPNVDDNAFLGGRVALSWVGHWEFARYHDAHGDDLLVLPLPNFGGGAKTGQGSWNWAITKKAPNPEAAAAFISFLLEDEQILAMTNANSAVPATKSAISKSPLYQENAPLRLFARQLSEGYSVPRPRTPAYGAITTEFEQAFKDIMAGGEVQSALTEAAEAIDRDIEANQGYPVQ